MTAGAAVVEWKLGVLLGGSWNRRCCVSSRFREERTQQNKPRGTLRPQASLPPLTPSPSGSLAFWVWFLPA